MVHNDDVTSRDSSERDVMSPNPAHTSKPRYIILYDTDKAHPDESTSTRKAHPHLDAPKMAFSVLPHESIVRLIHMGQSV